MLRSDLVRLIVRGARARVLFAGEDDLDLFSEVLRHLRPGLKLGEALEELKPLRRIYDPKLVDGITEVALRYLVLEEESPVSPYMIRQKLFEGGPALSEEERRRRLEEVTKQLGVDAERFMYSDLDLERVIVSGPAIGPRDLMEEYNMEELEGLLLRSYMVTLEVSDNWKDLLRSIKAMGLMYYARSRPVQVDVYGPVSLAKLTDRYGRLMARLVPHLLRSASWRLRAQVAVGRTRRIVTVEVTSDDAPMPTRPTVSGITFDSSVEEDLYRKLTLLAKDSGWLVIREPEPLVTSTGEIMIPDFAVISGSSKVFIEVVGFWTKEYINAKLRKLAGLRDPILLVVNESLGVGAFKLTGHDVVSYKDKVNVAPIYEWLKARLSSHAGRLPERLDVEGSYVSFEDVARRYGVTVDDVRRFNGTVEGYVKLRNYFVKRGLLDSLSRESLEGRRLSELTSKYGPWVQEALALVGYSLKWMGLNDAVVVKVRARP